MREIEFRGKCKEDGEWIDGNLIINHNYCSNKIECCSIYSMDIVDGNGSYCGYDFVEIDPETVGQYTGLKDKNGKKIYEGDIIKSNHNRSFYKVYWEDYRFTIEDKWGNLIKPHQRAIDHFECEVIGNRWENPELEENEDD